MTKDARLVDGVVSDYSRTEISAAERALLDLAVKLTVEPWAVGEADIAKLRAAGWTDRAILDLTLVVGYFAFVSRLAQGLGVQMEQERDELRSVVQPANVQDSASEMGYI